MKIFLLGFMGAGKTHAGKLLAERIGVPFVDLDAEIERLAQRPITDIFAADGEEAFRTLEARTLRTFTQGPFVMAAGGGTPCFHDNLAWMRGEGTTVFLDPAEDILLGRLTHGRAHRPVLSAHASLATLITEKLRARRPVYASADVHLAYAAADFDVTQALMTRLFPEAP